MGKKNSSLNKLKKLLYSYLKKLNFRLNLLKRKLNKLRIEKMKSFGSENPQNIYYIIHRNDEHVGLFSNVSVFLEQIEYALRKGYIPLIDMKNYLNAYLEPDQIGKINAWEYYFKQPFENLSKDEYSLESAYRSKSVIINNGEYLGSVSFFDPEFLFDAKNIKKWGDLYKKYIRLNEATNKYIDVQYSKIISDTDKVLGVFCRGTDYRKLRPYGHPIQPDVNDVVDRVKFALVEWKCNKIFLSTEDSDIYSIFKKNFGAILVSNEREYFSSLDEQIITQISHERPNDKYLNGLEYITSLAILSRCNCIISSVTSGVVGAVLMSEGFENSYFYNCGLYGISDEKK